MKSNRFISFLVVALTLIIIVGQSLGSGVKAAPANGITASVSARLAQTSAGAVANQSQPPSDTVQHFQDVPVGSFWYDYTASLFNEGVTTGYPCGTPPAGQCVPPNNLPYYLPNQNIIRGQVAAFFSRSLAPGVYITGPYTGTTGRRGAFNATNTNLNSNLNAGLYGKGPHGIDGIADSNGSNNSAGGYFDNPITYTTVSNYGVYAQATNGVGVYGSSAGNTGSQQSTGVVGVSTDSQGAGGVFTGTNAGVIGYDYSASGIAVRGMVNSDLAVGVYGFSLGGDSAIGVVGVVDGTNSYGVIGGAFIHPSSIGGYFHNYDQSTSAVGLHVDGKGTATGGFVTGGSYDIFVRYDGTTDLHPGDVLALDGLKSTLDNAPLLGTVKADANNSATIGVAQYRCDVYQVHTPADSPDRPALEAASHALVQVDGHSTSFKPGDLIDIVVLGTAQMKVSGNLKVGDHLTLAGNGSVVAAKGDAESIGKLATLPDKDGYATVFVNFK